MPTAQQQHKANKDGGEKREPKKKQNKPSPGLDSGLDKGPKTSSATRSKDRRQMWAEGKMNEKSTSGSQNRLLSEQKNESANLKIGRRKLSVMRLKRKKTRDERTEPPGLVFLRWADPRHTQEPRRRAHFYTCRGRVSTSWRSADPASSKRDWHHFSNVICSTPTSLCHIFLFLLSEDIPHLQDIPVEHRMRSPLTGTQDALQDRSHVPVQSPASTPPTLCDPMACSPPGPPST